ncbi:sensor histidine kinase [Plebeiibacterium marinum]|uniref:histidine kinase n=1 Tax=Plebeiibacterium marinum TaxID=2992111 RepID=A0AAE3MCD1_9BACT|nr:HAMP domain-containing sensor histidine kinase [Plebeiobacterium marinum]MCW3805161.1 HAMP domain-containing histidine kinase [Plebeiobacterium marinum]
MGRKIVKQWWLAIVTFLVLLCLVIIQVLFLVKSARLEEKHFNHRVVLALREARNEIAREANMCNNMHSYVCGNQCSTDMQYINFQKVDSIIQSNLYIHKIHLEYKFEFINENDSVKDKICVTCYEQSLNGLLAQNGIKLLIEFPDNSKFVFAQLGTLFYISIASILFVMISFVIIYRLFTKEQSILSNTKYFIDNMVHEFQTPLANVKFASGLIKKKVNASDEREKVLQYTQLIQDENEKLRGHVDDILKVVSLYSDKKGNEKVDVRQVLNACVESFRTDVERKHGEIKVDFCAGDFVVKGDATHIKHVFSNVIDNSIKYTKQAPYITIETINKRGKLVVSVKDNGVGIPSAELDKVFEKYYRVSTGNIHDIKGFGLGLNFVKNVVDKYKGAVKIKSEVNKGTMVIIELKLDCSVKK